MTIAPVPNHPALIFVTAGLGMTNFSMDIANGRGDVSFTDVRPAWGGGFQVPISRKVTLRVDYLHVSFGKQLNMTDAVTSGIFDANDGNFIKLKDVESRPRRG